MDALSRWVRLAGLQASLDLRCQFGDAYAVDHDPAPPGEIVFHLVLAGECLIEVHGEPTLPMRAGDFAAFPGGAAHRVRSIVSPAGARPVTVNEGGALALRRNGANLVELDLLCGRFSQHAPGSDAFLRSLPGAFHVSLSESNDEADLQRIVGLIRREVDAALPGAIAVVAALSNVLFTLALRVVARRDTAPPGYLKLASDARLSKALQAMLADIARDWRVEALAGVAAMSRATFARRFQEAAAQTPGEFLARLRMARAGELLAQTNRGIADIGAEVGYRSEAAFAKAFRKAMGESPAAFRKAAVV